MRVSHAQCVRVEGSGNSGKVIVYYYCIIFVITMRNYQILRHTFIVK